VSKVPITQQRAFWTPPHQKLTVTHQTHHKCKQLSGSKQPNYGKTKGERSESKNVSRFQSENRSADG